MMTKKTYPRATCADKLRIVLSDPVPPEEIPEVLSVIETFVRQAKGQEISDWLAKELSETGGIPL